MKIEHTQEWLDGYRAALETVKMHEEKAADDFDRMAERDNSTPAKEHANAHRATVCRINNLLAVNKCDQLLKEVE